MAVFEYKALIKSTGKMTRGVIDAENAAQARRKLREQELYPTEIFEDKSGGGPGAASQTARKWAFRRGRISMRDIALMTRQLAVLLRAGMPVLEALNA